MQVGTARVAAILRHRRGTAVRSCRCAASAPESVQEGRVRNTNDHKLLHRLSGYPYEDEYSLQNRQQSQLPRFYVSEQPLRSHGVYQLDAEDSKHLIKVLRLGVGDAVELVDGTGRLQKAQISTVNKSSAAVCLQITPMCFSTPSCLRICNNTVAHSSTIDTGISHRISDFRSLGRSKTGDSSSLWQPEGRPLGLAH